MDELSSVLGDVLRALGMEGDARIRLPPCGGGATLDSADCDDAGVAGDVSRG